MFTPDGHHVAYVAIEDAKWLAVVDGEPGPEYDGILYGGPVFHSDGVLEYLAIRGRMLFRVKHVPTGK